MLLRPSKVIFHEQAVTLVDQSFSIVSIVVDGNINVFLSLKVIVLQEVKERDI